MSPSTVRNCPAPAKLNLFLHVTGRRADGYHLLETVFELIDLQDTLHFERRHDGQVSREDLSGLALPPDDLIVHAARALQQATGCTQGVHVGVHGVARQLGVRHGTVPGGRVRDGLRQLRHERRQRL